jgi:BlaI family penicillinase repressor
VDRATYTAASAGTLASNYFKGSFKSMVSFFMEQEDLSVQDLEEILKEVNKD